MNPRASTRILEPEATNDAARIALGLLDAQAAWLRTSDARALRRALLDVLALLDQ